MRFLISAFDSPHHLSIAAGHSFAQMFDYEKAVNVVHRLLFVIGFSFCAGRF